MHAVYGVLTPHVMVLIVHLLLIDPHDFHEATALFMQQLQLLVTNAKLDRHLDSHPPLPRINAYSTRNG
jgi:hypothetical protein